MVGLTSYALLPHLLSLLPSEPLQQDQPEDTVSEVSGCPPSPVQRVERESDKIMRALPGQKRNYRKRRPSAFPAKENTVSSIVDLPSSTQLVQCTTLDNRSEAMGLNPQEIFLSAAYFERMFISRPGFPAFQKTLVVECSAIMYVIYIFMGQSTLIYSSPLVASRSKFYVFARYICIREDIKARCGPVIGYPVNFKDSSRSIGSVQMVTISSTACSPLTGSLPSLKPATMESVVFLKPEIMESVSPKRAFTNPSLKITLVEMDTLTEPVAPIKVFNNPSSQITLPYLETLLFPTIPERVEQRKDAILGHETFSPPLRRSEMVFQSERDVSSYPGSDDTFSYFAQSGGNTQKSPVPSAKAPTWNAHGERATRDHASQSDQSFHRAPDSGARNVSYRAFGAPRKEIGNNVPYNTRFPQSMQQRLTVSSYDRTPYQDMKGQEETTHFGIPQAAPLKDPVLAEQRSFNSRPPPGLGAPTNTWMASAPNTRPTRNVPSTYVPPQPFYPGNSGNQYSSRESSFFSSLESDFEKPRATPIVESSTFKPSATPPMGYESVSKGTPARPSLFQGGLLPKAVYQQAFNQTTFNFESVRNDNQTHATSSSSSFAPSSMPQNSGFVGRYPVGEHAGGQATRAPVAPAVKERNTQPLNVLQSQFREEMPRFPFVKPSYVNPIDFVPGATSSTFVPINQDVELGGGSTAATGAPRFNVNAPYFLPKAVETTNAPASFTQKTMAVVDKPADVPIAPANKSFSFNAKAPVFQAPAPPPSRPAPPIEFTTVRITVLDPSDMVKWSLLPDTSKPYLKVEDGDFDIIYFRVAGILNHPDQVMKNITAKGLTFRNEVGAGGQIVHLEILDKKKDYEFAVKWLNTKIWFLARTQRKTRAKELDFVFGK